MKQVDDRQFSFSIQMDTCDHRPVRRENVLFRAQLFFSTNNDCETPHQESEQ